MQPYHYFRKSAAAGGQPGFCIAPLGEVEAHSIGEIKNIMVDKIEEIEPPLAHMIPEGTGHIMLPVVSLLALAVH